MDCFGRDGLLFDVRDSGPADGPIALLLHGFPQSAACWDQVTPLLATAGCRVLAPHQRGYSPRARPTGRRAYRADELVADVVALVETAGGQPVHLVGHDWGAVVAWLLAAQRPELVTSLTALSVPHPAAFLRAVVSSRQALASWYMAAFQLPWLPELALRPDRARGRKLLRRLLIGYGQQPQLAERDLDFLDGVGGLRGGLGWYRALPLVAPGSVRGPVAVPTTFAWSDGDRAITRRAAELTSQHVTGPYRFEVLSGVSHWIPDEAPGVVADLVAAQLR